jgi:hypothetical protein
MGACDFFCENQQWQKFEGALWLFVNFDNGQI